MPLRSTAAAAPKQPAATRRIVDALLGAEVLAAARFRSARAAVANRWRRSRAIWKRSGGARRLGAGATVDALLGAKVLAAARSRSARAPAAANRWRRSRAIWKRYGGARRLAAADAAAPERAFRALPERASPTRDRADALKALPHAREIKEKLAAADTHEKNVLVNKEQSTAAVRLKAPPRAPAVLKEKHATSDEKASLQAVPAKPRETRVAPKRRDAPVVPLAPHAASHARPSPARVAVDDAPARAPECRIEWSRGYLKSQFFAVEEPAEPPEGVVAVSPEFRWRKPFPPPPDGAAAEAHAALVARLERDGWTVIDTGATWFSLRLSRPAAPAQAATSEAETSS